MVAARQGNVNKRKGAGGNPKAGNARKFKAGPGGAGGPNIKQRMNNNMRAGFGAMFNTNQMPDNPGYMDFNEPTGRFSGNQKFFKNSANNGKQQMNRPSQQQQQQHHQRRGNMNNNNMMHQRGGNSGGGGGIGNGGGGMGGQDAGNNNGANMGARWMGPRMGNQSNNNMRQGMARGNPGANGPFRGGPMPPRMPPMGGGPGGPMPPMMRPPMPPPMSPHMNGRFGPGGPPMMPPQMNRNMPIGGPGGPNGPMRRPLQFRMGAGPPMNHRNQQPQRNGTRQGKVPIKNNLNGPNPTAPQNAKGNLNKKRKGPMRPGQPSSSSSLASPSTPAKAQHQSVNKYPLDRPWVTDEIREAHNKKVEIETQLKGKRNDELFAQYKLQLDKFVGLYETAKNTHQNNKDNDKNLIESDKSNGEQNNTSNKPNASTV